MSREAVKFNPNNQTAHNTLGVMLKEQGKLSEAEAEYRKAMALDQDYAEPRSNLAGLLADKGKVLYGQGKRSEAEAAFREALTLNPSSQGASQGLTLMKMSEPGTSSAPTSSSLAGLEFMVSGNKPTEQPGKSPQGTITLVIKEKDGSDVPVTFIIPHDPKSGPGQASAQVQSAAASGAQAKEAADKAANDFHDPQGKLAEASHHAGDMFDHPGQEAKPLPPVEYKGLPVQKQMVIPDKVIKDEKFKNLVKTRAALIEKQADG